MRSPSAAAWLLTLCLAPAVAGDPPAAPAGDDSSAAIEIPIPEGTPDPAPGPLFEPITPQEAAAAELLPPCANQKARVEAIKAALERRPDDPALHYYLSGAWAACGNIVAALAQIDRVIALGDGFMPVRDLGFERIWDDARFRARRIAMELALPEVTDAALSAALPNADLIPEGIAVDPSNGRLFLGSAAQGRIVEVGDKGEPLPFAGPTSGLDQVLGMTVDTARGWLYVVNTNRLIPKADAPPVNAVYAFDLRTKVRIRLLDAAGAGQLNDVAVAADGTVFASDSRDGAIYRANLKDTGLALWMPPDTFPGANGLALSDDGRALYVAHATGIARVELATGDIRVRIGNATRETLAAIDGLYQRAHKLYGVQNVTNPGRVIEIQLDAAGTTVTGVETMLSHHRPELAEPTAAAFDGNDLLVLANSFFGRLRSDGTLRDPGTLKGPIILAVPLVAP
ncbi:MAG TPA: hypothetical protein VJM11_04815 [Nevskiaceae bacterium]|nr:hypothetical protein [Nevskiaceae bacterium]